MTHKYETSNNVKGWKMMLTQNTGANKETDRKFKAFKRIANESKALALRLDEEYKKEQEEMKIRNTKNERQCQQHQKGLAQSQKEKL